jgi:hypothetical protein
MNAAIYHSRTCMYPPPHMTCNVSLTCMHPLDLALSRSLSLILSLSLSHLRTEEGSGARGIPRHCVSG